MPLLIKRIETQLQRGLPLRNRLLQAGYGIAKDAGQLHSAHGAGPVGAQDNVKILTSCPSCLQGLNRYEGDLNNGLLEADYIVVEMANQILGENWMPNYVALANNGGIERVLV